MRSVVDGCLALIGKILFYLALLAALAFLLTWLVGSVMVFEVGRALGCDMDLGTIVLVGCVLSVFVFVGHRGG